MAPYTQPETRWRLGTAYLVIALCLAIFIAGCIQSPPQLGCCLKQNASTDKKCQLFNISSSKIEPGYLPTSGCDDSNCNVTIGSNPDGSAMNTSIPVCSDNNPAKCLAPDCQAMVCGDFKYKQTIPPGIPTEENAGEGVPPPEEEIVQGLFNARCQFLDVDAKFGKILKKTNGAMNIFRFGIGENFDEFDVYHYYFPISDKYCNINPGGKIDRYMNYLAPVSSTPSDSYARFDPINNLSIRCLNDSNFASLPSSFWWGLATTRNPDLTGYKFLDYYRVVRPFVLVTKTATGTSCGDAGWMDFGVNLSASAKYNGGEVDDSAIGADQYKRIDQAFYRKALSTMNLDKFYSQDASRASFECDSSAYDCISGFCNKQFYNRGANIVTNPDKSESTLPTDCKSVRSAQGNEMVICYPTISASVTGTGDVAFQYAKVSLRPVQFQLATEDYPQSNLVMTYDDKPEARQLYRDAAYAAPYDWWNCLRDNFHSGQNRCTLEYFWQNFFNGSTYGINHWRETEPNWAGTYYTDIYRFYDTRPNTELFGEYQQVSLLPSDFGIYWNGTDTIWWMDTTGMYPPAGQIVFFNSDDIKYRGQSIIGYAVLDRGELAKTYFGKNCIYATTTHQVNYSFSPCSGDIGCYKKITVASCVEECTEAIYCGPGKAAACNSYCEGRVNESATPEVYSWNRLVVPEPPIPCTYTYNTTPYASNVIEVDLSGSNFKDNYQALMDAFAPLFNQTMEDYAQSGDWNMKCGGWNVIDSSDLFLAGMPWIPAYKKDMAREGNKSILNSPALQFFRDQDNIYEQEIYRTGGFGPIIKGTAPFKSNTICQLESMTVRRIGLGRCAADWRFVTYRVLMPKYVYLLKNSSDAEGNGKIGRCDLVKDSVLPKLASYGWCEPCTVATMAYQKVTANSTPYIPLFEADANFNVKTVCTYEATKRETGKEIKNNLTCSNPEIANIEQYSNTDPYSSGAPRTIPEATLLKERLGNYLKSGIMPVIDLSDTSNWNKTSPYIVEHVIPLGYNFDTYSQTYDVTCSKTYDEYDFQRLLGNEGAIVTVVATLSGSKTVTGTDQAMVLNRTTVIRGWCPRCMTAVMIAASDNQSFNKTLSGLFTDARVRRNVDIITFNYTTASTSGLTTSQKTPSENADIVLENLASYGRMAVEGYSKPSIVTGFYTEPSAAWNDNTYETLYTSIIENSSVLVRNGIMGIIYAPVRSNYAASSAGFVNNQSGIGIKTSKFCGLETAAVKLALGDTRTVFTRMVPVNEINCTPCTSLEISRDECDKQCDNGVECNLPAGATNPRIYKCPAGTVLNPCKPCNATEGTFSCEYKYVNGTVQTQPFAASDVSSDMYTDVMAGLSKPDKCCIQDSSGANYTYGKMLMSSSVTTPIIFSKSGNPEQDCNLGTGDITSGAAICGMPLPINDFDVNCKIQ